VVDDPLAVYGVRLVAGARGPIERVDALLSLEAVFPRALVGDARFTAAVRRQALVLAERGAFGAIEAVLAVDPGARL
jgi:mannitol-1-phosphate/altronate dehydrogenase